MGLIAYLRKRPLGVVGAMIGALIFVLIFLRGENTRTQVGTIKREVRIIRQAAPCTGLTRRECAVYLLGALSEQQKRSIGVTERRLTQLERQTARARENAKRNGTTQAVIGGKLRRGIPDEPTATSPKPSTSPTGPSGSPSSPPLVQTPTVGVPPIGPVGPIVVPGISVPCVVVKPLVTCGGR
jgi:hypothetical protein